MKVLDLLGKNAKTSDREIASLLKTSQSIITRDRTFLEKTGIIKNYHTVIDMDKLILKFLKLDKIKDCITITDVPRLLKFIQQKR